MRCWPYAVRSIYTKRLYVALAIDQYKPHSIQPNICISALNMPLSFPQIDYSVFVGAEKVLELCIFSKCIRKSAHRARSKQIVECSVSNSHSRPVHGRKLAHFSIARYARRTCIMCMCWMLMLYNTHTFYGLLRLFAVPVCAAIFGPLCMGMFGNICGISSACFKSVCVCVYVRL